MEGRRTEETRVPIADRGELQVYLSFQDAARQDAVVFVHGFGSSRVGEKPKALEQACARRGWTFVAFDFRGHGTSTGTMLELKGSGLLEDLEHLQKFLAGRGIRRLFPVGSSMGGWAAGWFTLRHPEVVPACAMIAPALDFVRHRWSRLGEHERQQWRQTGRLRVQNEWVDTEIGYCLVEEIDQFPVERLAQEWRQPLLIFHGMQDDSVPHTHSIAFLESLVAPDVEMRLYRNGDHRLVAWKDEMAEAACRFFEKCGAVSKSE